MLYYVFETMVLQTAGCLTDKYKTSAKGLACSICLQCLSTGHTIRGIKACRKTPCPHLIQVQTFNLEEVGRKINVINTCKTCFLF